MDWEMARLSRFAFRFLGNVVSPQSDKAVFTFPLFRGHKNRFILENDNRWSILCKRETGWLYQQTEQLNQVSINVTYSGDQPFLLRLIMGNSEDDYK